MGFAPRLRPRYRWGTGGTLAAVPSCPPLMPSPHALPSCAPHDMQAPPGSAHAAEDTAKLAELTEDIVDAVRVSRFLRSLLCLSVLSLLPLPPSEPS